MTQKIFLSTLFLILGYSCMGQAQAGGDRPPGLTYCVFDTKFLPADKGNASKVEVNDQGHLEVTTSDKNTLKDFTIWMVTDVEMRSAYRGGDSCFFSPMAAGSSYTVDNLSVTTLSETHSGCGHWIGKPDGNHTYKGHAVNFSVPNAYAYEIWGCKGTVTLKLHVSVKDPTQSFRTRTQKGQLFDPRSPLLKTTSGQVSRDLNGAYQSNMTFPLFVKSQDCFVQLRSKVSANKAAPVQQTFSAYWRQWFSQLAALA